MAMTGIFVTATDTEVGKTFVSGLLVRTFRRRGINAGYFKPVASGCLVRDGELVAEDLLAVEHLTGERMDQGLHCPVRYQNSMAPYTASRLEDRPFSMDAVARSLERLKSAYPVLVVEGIGGVMVPLDRDYRVLDMMADMRFPALVAARPGLGTINHTLLTLAALKRKGIPVLGFLTTGHRAEDDPAAMTGPAVISEFSGVACLGHIPLYDPEKTDMDAFVERSAPFLSQLVDRVRPR